MAESGSIGSRIRFYRRRLGMTQEVLAGRAGVSPTWLSQVERGLRSGSRLATLLPVAEVLGVDLAALVDTPRRRVPGPSGRVNGVRDLVEALLRHPDRFPDAPDTELGSLGRRLEHAEGLVRLCRFQEAGPLLGSLIGDAEAAVRAHETTEREEAAYALLSHVYRASTWALVRAGEEQGPRWVASERCSAAARRSGDPVVTGLAADHRSNVYARTGLVAEAREVLMRAIDALAPAAEATEQPLGPWLTPEPAAVWGSLLLGAAIWAAHANDRADAHRLLRRAEATASRVRRDDDLFGLTGTAVYQVACAVQLGDLSDALRLGAAIDTSHLDSFDRSRPAALRVHMAQAHELRGEDADALLWLTEAERLAPEWIRGGRAEVREMVGAMLRRERRRRPGLRELADRVGVVD
jgi:transcriptional regulator with XRE-family HTH domain